MAKVLIDVPDEFIDWARWAQHNLDQGGLKGSVQVVDEGVKDDPGPAAPSEPEDPWADPTAGARTTTTTSPAPTSAPVSSAEPGLPETPPRDYSNFTVEGKTHSFNIEGAPVCSHGQPAVRVSGTKQGGKTWKQYRCALSSTKRWQDKCDFTQWA